jgi:hypothetical protein
VVTISSLKGAITEQDAKESQKPNDTDDPSNDQSQAQGLVGLIGPQLLQVFPVLNARNNERKGTQTDQCQSQVPGALIPKKSHGTAT